MGEDPPDVIPVSGDDVILWMGCSEEWCWWAVDTIRNAMDAGREAVHLHILLKEGDGWRVITDWRETIQAQLGGDDAERLLPHAPYEYRLGFSDEDARRMLSETKSVLNAGADGYDIHVPVSIEKSKKLALQLREQKTGNLRGSES